MRCYYEELALERNANESEIKSAYRKLALKWHPDKNLESLDVAKERFQLIQQAYEVLSDPQERAWYDNHREQILRGKNSNFEDNCLDLFQYFTVACFKGFGDDENGFYAVYREVFKKISAEDAEFLDNEEDLFKIPNFGDAKSNYEEIVGPFYAYWSAYCTKRTYAWLCPYDIREVKDRRVLREIEKEMKKVAQKAKKERNEEVRNLVSFVRKRDKRVQAFKKMLEERSAFNREKQERNRMEQKRRRQQEIEQMKNSSETTNINDDYEEKLKQLELEYSSDDDLEDEDSEEFENIESSNYNDGLYCVACNKEFKTEKSFANHELSRKHRDNIERLKLDMQEEEKAYVQEENIIELTETETKDAFESNENLVSNREDLEASTENRSKTKHKKESKSTKQFKELESGANKVEISEEINGLNKSPEDDVGWDSKNKKLGKKNKKGRTCKTNCSFPEQPVHLNTEQTFKATGENFVLKSDKIQFLCATCKSNFESKNKLFAHLKLTNHAVFLPNTKTTNEENIKSGKSKGKRRK